MKIINPEKSTAQILLEKYCDAYNRRDLPLILSLFTKDCNLWGTAIDEYRKGLKELEDQHLRDWSQSEKSEILIQNSVPTEPEATWAAAICQAAITIDGQRHVVDHLRGTITIRQEDNQWKISHMHASFPDYRNAENGSFPVQ